jgi:2-(1,2-epoxy-1,2-dihydrophenyl)acetyl-CoA isomerase
MSVKFEVNSPGLATITLNRPERYNALDLASIEKLQEITQAVADNPQVRVLVIQGEGSAFSGGGDIGYFASRGGDTRRMLVEIGRALNPVILNLRRMDAVVVMSVHGSVAGGSVGLMLAGDLVVAASGTKFNLGYARMGGSPDAGVSWFLTRFAGHLAAFELLALSETFDTERARQLGLVNYVVPPQERAGFTAGLAARLSRSAT